ncbi:MAG: anti-sigma factor [Anditalea sp.]
MNLEEYISSGIIETYVLGLAGEEEARELEQLCLQYPEVQAAVREAEIALEDYAQLHAITPPDDVKEKIWSAIEDSQHEVKPVLKEKAPEASKGIYRLYPFISKAAVLLIIIGLPYHFYKISQYQSEIETLQREKNEIMAQNQIYNAQIKEVNQELNILSDPSTRNILLAGVAGHEENNATVYWSDSGEVFLKSSGLTPLPQDKQYQLWAIVDGKPVSAGLLEKDGTIYLQKMATIERAEMFAITIEKHGGSEQPTLDQMVVAGKALS